MQIRWNYYFLFDTLQRCFAYMENKNKMFITSTVKTDRIEFDTCDCI